MICLRVDNQQHDNKSSSKMRGLAITVFAVMFCIQLPHAKKSYYSEDENKTKSAQVVKQKLSPVSCTNGLLANNSASYLPIYERLSGVGDLFPNSISSFFSGTSRPRLTRELPKTSSVHFPSLRRAGR